MVTSWLFPAARRTGEDDAEQTDTELVARKKSTSVIWRYFGYKITDTEQREQGCQLSLIQRETHTIDTFTRSHATHPFSHAEKTHEAERTLTPTD